MQKKLIAAAVAGVLAAPVVAQAQSTVQIYGNANWQYGSIDQGPNRPRGDYNEVTDSYIGFKGTESLGGGISAWFQCETTMDIRAFDQVGLCSRNSGLGFRGGFGNVWGGRWHTPFSRIYHQIGAEGGTGIFGVAKINGSSGSTSFADDGGNAGGNNRQQFRRRESCLTTYETPRFGGFMVGAAISCGNAASDTGQTTLGTTSATNGATNGANNKKPRVYSIAGTYNQGPLGLGLGYQRHDEVGTFAQPELSDRAWGASVRYTFGPVLAGATYMERKWEIAGSGAGAGTVGTVKNRTWTIGAEWNVAGPHTIGAFYGDTGDAKGSLPTGGAAIVTNGFTATGSDTGYDVWTLNYSYAFSKRTKATLAYVRYDNDSNSRSVWPYNGAQPNAGAGTNATALGQATDAWGISIKHAF